MNWWQRFTNKNRSPIYKLLLNWRIERNIAKLANADYLIQLNIIKTLGNIGDDRAVEPLRQQIKFRTTSITSLHPIQDERTRIVAVRALGKIRTNLAVQALIEALDDPVWRIREATVKELEYIGTIKVLGTLVDALNHEDSTITDHTIGLDSLSSAELLTMEIIPSLVNTLHDPADTTRNLAAKALNNIGLEYLSTDDKVLCLLILKRQISITIMKEKALPGLFLALDHHNFEIRKQAIESLGLLGNTKTIEPLIKILKEEKPDSLKTAAAKALQRIGFDHLDISIKILCLRILDGKDVILEMGESVIEGLVRLLGEDYPWNIRLDCAIMLGELTEKTGFEKVQKAILAFAADSIIASSSKESRQGFAILFESMFRLARKHTKKRVEGVLSKGKPKRPVKSKERLLRATITA